MTKIENSKILSETRLIPENDQSLNLILKSNGKCCIIHGLQKNILKISVSILPDSVLTINTIRRLLFWIHDCKWTILNIYIFIPYMSIFHIIGITSARCSSVITATNKWFLNSVMVVKIDKSNILCLNWLQQRSTTLTFVSYYPIFTVSTLWTRTLQ